MNVYISEVSFLLLVFRSRSSRTSPARFNLPSSSAVEALALPERPETPGSSTRETRIIRAMHVPRRCPRPLVSLFSLPCSATAILIHRAADAHCARK